MREGDAAERRSRDRMALMDALHRIEARQAQLDARRAKYEAMQPAPGAWLRRVRDDLDVLATERDLLAAGWDQLAVARDEAARQQDTRADEQDRVPDEAAGTHADVLRQAHTAGREGAKRDRLESRLDRDAAQEDRERSAADRRRGAGERARAKRIREREADAVVSLQSALGELIAADEEAELAHELTGALLEQLALTEINEYRLRELLDGAERARGRAANARRRAEQTRARMDQPHHGSRPSVDVTPTGSGTRSGPSTKPLLRTDTAVGRVP